MIKPGAHNQPYSFPECLLHDPVTWYKITHARTQVALWDLQNKATSTSPPWPAFVFEVPQCNLRPTMCDVSVLF